MRILSDSLDTRKKEIKFFLQDKNRWSRLPQIVEEIINKNIERITFISGNPDNINGVIRSAENCDYFDIKDMEIDFSLFNEWGIVNCRPGDKVGYIRITFIPLIDLKGEDYKVKCLEHKVDENDFLSSMMGGRI